MLPSLARMIFSAGAALHHSLDRRHVEECRRMVAWSGCPGDPAKTVREMYSSLWAIVPELFWPGDMDREALLGRIAGSREIQDYIGKLRPSSGPATGIVFVTAHLGNWELCGRVFSRLFSPMMSAYKPHPSKFVNRWMISLRSRDGQIPVAKEGAMMRMMRHLRGGGMVGLVVDQNAGDGGVESRFLERPCRSWTSPAELAIRSGCPLIPAALVREGGKMRIEWSEAVALDSAGEKSVAIEAAVRRIDAALSGMVRRHPGQWLWLGRKWGRNFDAPKAFPAAQKQ